MNNNRQVLSQVFNFVRLKGYIWNGRKGVYVSKWTTRAVQEKTVLKWADKYSDVVSQNISGLTDDLIAGKIDLAAWETKVAVELKNGHGVSHMIGRGGVEQMTQSNWGKVGAQLKKEYNFLNNFALDIKSGKLTAKQIRARAKMYAKKLRSSYYAGKTDAMKFSTMTQERRIVNPGETCEDCVAYEAMGWQPIGILPEPGDQSVCRSNCNCSKTFR